MEEPKKVCREHVGAGQPAEAEKELTIEAAIERRLDVRYRKVDETDPPYDG